ncbi:3-hydroxyacyl-ACP dehydratase FabZ family protein [Streptomyces sp. NBC_00454]|uniref:3-hydroxyacyl-ACP dehydratase FabZ family protein n=1 Tax=Streptomyces sp. NBC_00454 TaxID=2975747 RepID=UPI0030DDF4C4
MTEHAELRSTLPHRHPILVVDRVTELDPGVRIRTSKAISGSEPCYAGLPDDLAPAGYAFPNSLLLESFVQSAATLWLQKPEHPVGTLLFVGARKVLVQGEAYPGDVLHHEATLQMEKNATAIFNGTTRLASGEPVLSVSSLVLAIREG